jgi:hypothetical protein
MATNNVWEPTTGLNKLLKGINVTVQWRPNAPCNQQTQVIAHAWLDGPKSKGAHHAPGAFFHRRHVTRSRAVPRARLPYRLDAPGS